MTFFQLWACPHFTEGAAFLMSGRINVDEHHDVANANRNTNCPLIPVFPTSVCFSNTEAASENPAKPVDASPAQKLGQDDDVAKSGMHDITMACSRLGPNQDLGLASNGSQASCIR